MATIRGHDLQLQSLQKIMTKAMLPLVRLAESFLLAEVETPAMHSPTEALNACLDSFSLPSSANLHMDQMRREGFKAALPTRYKGLVNVPDPSTELLFGSQIICIRRRSWRMLCSLSLLPSLPRFLCIPVQERPMCLVLPPGEPIPASLCPLRLQKNCVISPQWTTCQRLRGNNPEEGSCTPKGKYFSLPSPYC